MQMRGPFGPGMGSGGGGGGGIIKTVHKAISRAGIGGGALTEPVAYSQSTTTRTINNHHQPPRNTALSLSSNNNLNHPVPATPTTTTDQDSDWECIHNPTTEQTVNHEVYDDSLFGTVPSKHEVHQAVSSLQEVLDVVSLSRYGIDNDKNVSCAANYFQKPGSDQLDWTEPSLELCNSITTGLHSSRVYDAFHLMQTEPSVQRMVISLSSDKSVWDAVMNNEVVRELRESISDADEEKSIWEEEDDVVDNGPNPVKQVLHWMFVNTKDKVIEIVEKITKIVNELVQPPAAAPKEKPKPKHKREGGSSNPGIEDKVRSSFLLSIMVFLIVVVTRSHTRRVSSM